MRNFSVIMLLALGRLLPDGDLPGTSNLRLALSVTSAFTRRFRGYSFGGFLALATVLQLPGAQIVPHFVRALKDGLSYTFFEKHSYFPSSHDPVKNGTYCFTVSGAAAAC